MTCLIVLCHPVPDSLSRHLGAEAESAARGNGWQVEVLDLMAIGFDPVMQAAERRGYYPGADVAPGMALDDLSAQLRRAEILILVFPTWWFGFPAILKGWFDRVWRPGIAFEHSPDMGRLIPRLTGLRHVVAITTLGSPAWIDRLILRQPLRRILRLSILKPCAPQARLHWLALHGAETAGPRQVRPFTARIRRRIARLSG